MKKKKREKRKPRVAAPRMIQFQEIPADYKQLAVNIAKLEKAVMITKNTVEMSFDCIIDKLMELKRESMTLIQQAKKKEASTSSNSRN